MLTIFRYMLVRLRGQVLGWGLVMLLVAFLTVARFDLMSDNRKGIQPILEQGSILQVMKAFGDPRKLFDPAAFLSMYFFNLMPLFLGVFAVLAGSGLLAADEESGTLDLTLAHPVSRTVLFFGRLLAFVVATCAILVLTWLGLVVGASRSQYMNLAAGDLLLPFVSLLALLLLYGCLGLLLATLLPSRRMAAMTAGLVLVGSFFLTMLGRMDDGIRSIARFLPQEYYESGTAMHGLEAGSVVGLSVAALLFAVLAWWRFERRDIRVCGEGVWKWPWQR
jgi:ABC-2 type transport system permease protein